jgi:hypothetical protein
VTFKHRNGARIEGVLIRKRAIVFTVKLHACKREQLLEHLIQVGIKNGLRNEPAEHLIRKNRNNLMFERELT